MVYMFLDPLCTWAARVSPATCNRLVDTARGVLNQFIPDIYLYTDHKQFLTWSFFQAV